VSQDDPKLLGRYEITGEIGRGTMGVVYRAVDPVLRRTVALKTVNMRLAVGEEDRASFEARFTTEARAAALLSHPAIVTVHDLGRDADSDTLYIALEHLEGRTLADIVREDGPLPWRRVLEIGSRVAGALDHAHARGIVHRDVKPANIMVLPGGDPKLMDFGIAKIDATNLTAPGDFLGTPSYMSPEQAAGGEMDGRSDIFSLGAVLYLALTGRRAFDAPTVPGVMARVVNEPAAPLGIAGIPEVVEQIVQRALAKPRDERYARASDLAEDIDDVLAGRRPRHLERSAPARAKAETRGTGDAVIRQVDRLGWRGLAILTLALALIAASAFFLKTREPVTATTSSPVAATPASAPAHAPAPARLEVAFRHPFRSGTLRVWLDGALALEQTVPGRVTRDLLALKLRRGEYTGRVDVPPGDHVVRVQVDDGGGFRESRRIRGTFASGQVRRLDAAVDGGVLGKDFAIAWRP
jgi:serine/threonine-protein kinase